MKKYITSILFSWLTPINAPCMHSANDSIRISLLTCEAGGEIYSLFGHTALRVTCPERRVDYVFNYGVFSFESRNFMLRFALGRTDYMLGIMKYNDFAESYTEYGRDVFEQELNLTGEEKWKLFERLMRNAQKENRVYRYNFFFDNCSTRPRDQIEHILKGRLHYAENMNEYVLREGNHPETFRDMIHLYAQESPWYNLGMDLCLGSPADRPMTRREKMFTPFYLRDCLAEATFTDSHNDRKPVVKADGWVVRTKLQDYRSKLPSPTLACWMLCLLTLVLSICEWRKKRLYWGADIVLFGAAGLGGCILFILNFFSEHPCVSGNYNLLALHPLHLLALPYIIHTTRKHTRNYYLIANGVVLTLFILFLRVIPQVFNPVILPLSLTLLIRCAIHSVIAQRQLHRPS